MIVDTFVLFFLLILYTASSYPHATYSCFPPVLKAVNITSQPILLKLGKLFLDLHSSRSTPGSVKVFAKSASSKTLSFYSIYSYNHFHLQQASGWLFAAVLSVPLSNFHLAYQSSHHSSVRIRSTQKLVSLFGPQSCPGGTHRTSFLDAGSNKYGFVCTLRDFTETAKPLLSSGL